MQARASATRRAAFVAAAAAGLVAAAVVATSAAAAASRTVTVYSVATGVQYINTADDRARGQGNNPFDANTNKLTPKVATTGNGPFAGDVAVYALKLYGNATLKKPAGTAVITCFFNYDEHALCQAYYRLATGGTLVASGPIDFKNTGFTIVVTGGTQAYLGVRGQVKVTATPNRAQKLDFELLS
jgi:hypothetical protein